MKHHFFVYIIESLTPNNFYKGIVEGKALSETLALSGINTEYKLTLDKKTFETSLKEGLTAAIEKNKGRPILHISAHGNEEGIKLTDTTFLKWSELADLLTPINESIGGFLLCLSSCHGYSGTQMAMDIKDDKLPFIAIVANSEIVDFADTSIAYSTFYHLFSKGHSVSESVNAMCKSSGNSNFFFKGAREVKDSYKMFIHDAQIQDIRTRAMQMRAIQSKP